MTEAAPPTDELAPVIDFRFRVPTALFDASAAGAHRAVWWHTRDTPLWRDESTVESRTRPRTIEACVAWLRERRVRAVLPGRGMPLVAIPNDHLHELCTTYPDCFVALAGIDAPRRRAAMDEIARCHALGFVGVHFETGWHRPPLLPDAPELWPLYAQCEDLGLLAVIHVGPLGGPTPAHADPAAVGRVARAFPDLRIVVSHGGYPNADAAVLCVFEHPNVWLAPDPYHQFPGGERYREWANRSDLVADRLLYGSSHGWPHAPDALAAFGQQGWRPDVLRRVLHTNAAQLLGGAGVSPSSSPA